MRKRQFLYVMSRKTANFRQNNVIQLTIIFLITIIYLNNVFTFVENLIGLIFVTLSCVKMFSC